jgi:hypothetical protein
MAKNYYKKQSEKASLLGSITKDLDTKHDAKNSIIETAKDIVVGVVAGGVTGSAIGRASLLIGAAVTGVGHYYKNRLASIFGIGMMAANGFQGGGSDMKGPELEGLEGVKERIMNFKESFSQKLYLDKLPMLKSKKKETTNGMGEVQYFSYPEKKVKELGEGPDLTALDRIEKQVADSGASFSQIHGNLPSMEMDGTEEGSGFHDLNERLF